jgi:hypothetical protein
LNTYIFDVKWIEVIQDIKATLRHFNIYLLITPEI